MPELKQLLTDISRAIVDCPDSVTVDEREEGDTIVFTLHVTESDMGKVIGKHGKKREINTCGHEGRCRYRRQKSRCGYCGNEKMKIGTP